jgi:hypothetical protein
MGPLYGMQTVIGFNYMTKCFVSMGAVLALDNTGVADVKELLLEVVEEEEGIEMKEKVTNICANIFTAILN